MEKQKLVVSRGDMRIFVLDRVTNLQGEYHSETGERLRGKLELDPDEVLYMAWAQIQPINLKETDLRKMWKARKESG